MKISIAIKSEMLSEHLEPFSGLSVEMKPYRLYNSAQEVVTIIVKRIKL
jgi:hypothetical protein